MRADRLISILMFLQKNGRMKAKDLAAELEVSERTIYRDVDALSFSGVPIYCERGPQGGIELLDRYRSDLTGLNKDEIRALFMVGIPAPLSDLGLDQEIKSALRKLTVALPKDMTVDEQRSRRFFIDPEPWEDSTESTPLLNVVQTAVWEERPLKLTYHSILGPRVGILESLVNPYGLVAKDGHWYLVCEREQHIFVLELDRLMAAAIKQTNFDFPDEFSLPVFWKNWVTNRQANHPTFEVMAVASFDIMPYLVKYEPEELPELKSPELIGETDQVVIKLSFSGFEEARGEILKFGGAIKVFAPQALRLSIADFARQTASVYS